MDTSKPGDVDFVEPPGEVWVAQTELTPGAVSLTGAIMQNVTHIAPAIAAFLFTTTIVGNAGGRAPLAYLIGFIIYTTKLPDLELALYGHALGTAVFLGIVGGASVLLRIRSLRRAHLDVDMSAFAPGDVLSLN